MKFTDKRLEKLDSTIAFYEKQKSENPFHSISETIVLISHDLLNELVADVVGRTFIDFTNSIAKPHYYKNHPLIIDWGEDYLAVAYFNKRTGITYKFTEIKGEES